MRASKSGVWVTATVSRAKNAARFAAAWSQPCEWPPRRRIGASDRKTQIAVPATSTTSRSPPQETHSLAIPKRSSIRIVPHANAVRSGRRVSSVISARTPRPAWATQYRTRSGSKCRSVGSFRRRPAVRAAGAIMPVRMRQIPIPEVAAAASGSGRRYQINHTRVSDIAVPRQCQTARACSPVANHSHRPAPRVP